MEEELIDIEKIAEEALEDECKEYVDDDTDHTEDNYFCPKAKNSKERRRATPKQQEPHNGSAICFRNP